MGASSNEWLDSTQQQPTHQFVHRFTANAATENVTQDVHLTIMHKFGSRKNPNQSTIWCKYMNITVKVHQHIV